jgi:energy-coupling factor transporter ATP-binding protein EcfA2
MRRLRQETTIFFSTHILDDVQQVSDTVAILSRGELVIIAVEILFYLSLTLMLGAFFNQRGPVLAIPLALVFLQQPLIGLVPPLFYVAPYPLSAALAGAVAFGDPLPFITPLLATMMWSVIFTGLAIWRFGREEF